MSAPAAARRVLVLGSGALQIGQAGEFDYAGSQALKALREEGVHAVLHNPNIATIQTSHELADVVYLLPVDPHFVERVIVEERIDGILLGFGGQTALNCGLALAAAGVLARHGVEVLGTPVSAIRTSEDRLLFNRALAAIDVKVARSKACASPAEAIAAAHELGLPVILRGAFALGGKGSAIVRDADKLEAAATRAFGPGTTQVLVEECLAGWKEIEYEIVRDAADNCIAVCNLENLDPMGIHTGESIVVAPSQTLDDDDYQRLRSIAIRTIRHLGIVGECNIQYALDPRTSDYRVIEVNPRLSRSSALASKATGYPLAYVAAKIALGYTLPELQNAITRKTSACFEPALDYVVCKAPRWDLDKFTGVDPRLGPEMKSVGEVMAIGRTLGEALQKALRMLELGVDGLDPRAFDFADLEAELRNPTPRRIFAVARAFAEGRSIEDVARLTTIDPWFLAEIARVVALDGALRGATLAELDRARLRTLKQAGFADRAIAARVGATEDDVRAQRWRLGVRPGLAQIDTLAAEYPAETNYLYLTHAADGHDVAPRPSTPALRAYAQGERGGECARVLVLGSGCYRIGSSVEFDWCCVTAAATARALGVETVVLNSNPETVSTDYDTSDLLVFDEISIETVLELCDVLRPGGVIVSMGGQTPNSLALELARLGVPLLGTPAASIDRAEDRRKFSALCDELAIDQPRWATATAAGDLDRIVDELGGYPVVVRPSYVLSGAAMRVAHGADELRGYLARATDVSPAHPVVISRFEHHAREIELDAVADHGEVVLWAVSEHVEDAGVHSGDATLVLPPQRLYPQTVREVRAIGARLARALDVTGPFNVQLLARRNRLKVIECNLRASRSAPFVSKVLGTNFIAEATRLMLGAPRTHARAPNQAELDYVAVKAPQFSFRRLTGADPLLGIEMASTGEVACFGADGDEALLKAMLATGFRVPTRGVLLSLGPIGDKYRFADEARLLQGLGLALYATVGTGEILRAEGITCTYVDKDGPGGEHPDALDALRRGLVDLVVNVPRSYDASGRPDGFRIRRAAIDLEIPLVTDLWLARRLAVALAAHRVDELAALPWHAYVPRD